MINEQIESTLNKIKLKNFKLQDIYEIPNLCKDINSLTLDGELLLIYSLYNLSNRIKLFHALLQCGCDMFALNDDGISAYYLTLIEETNDIPEDTREIFKLYYPGLWPAVDHNNIELVRKSINLWCRPDIERNGLSLMGLAEERQNKPILNLLNSISKSVLLAHAVLSDNAQQVIDVLNTGIPKVTVQQGGINVNIQNLGALGATPLYFAMQNNNEQIVETLIEWGANSAKVLTLENEIEIPIIFLSLRPNIAFDIFKIIIKKSSEFIDLSLLRYRSCSLLHCAVDNDVSLDKIEYLLQIADAKLLSVRSSKNVCAIDITQNCTIKEIIKKKIENEYCNLEFLLDLISYGYESFIDILNNSDNLMKVGNLDILNKYLHHIKQFTKNVSESNIIGIQKYMVFTYIDPINGTRKRRYLVNCFGYGDGQPMLHKAVLRCSIKVVQLLCSVIVGTLSRKIDDTIDQYGRTALCYAYLIDPREISETLIQFGASEYTTDFENRSPLAFRDKYTHSMKDRFLSYHLNKDYREDEPSLWDKIYQSRSYMTYGKNINDSSNSHPENCIECSKNEDKLSQSNCNNRLNYNEDEEGNIRGNNDTEVDDDDEEDGEDDEPSGVCILS